MNEKKIETEEWRKAADENLRKENSWLALAGLYWLNEGENSFGTDPSNSIVFPSGSGSPRMGVFDLIGDQVTLRVEEGIDLSVDGEIISEISLKPDTSGSPTEIKYEDLTFILIEREDGFGIRLWDNQRTERKDFSGRVWFPIQEEYRVKGTYEPFEEELSLILGRKNGSDLEQQAQGQIKFQLNDQDVSLVALAQEDGSLFILFHDLTNGNETYPAGRYLLVAPPDNGSIIIDFNRAYNPPCSFTDYATCPLPPPQNKLNLAIQAGEKWLKDGYWPPS
jgi:uncharacterized protein (DUF1684 family)